MKKRDIKPAQSMTVPKQARAISIVSFQTWAGWDIVEYDDGGQSKHKIAEVGPEVPLDRMTDKESADFIANILAVYDERLQSPMLGIRAKHLKREEVRALYNKVQVGATALPKDGSSTH